MPRGPGPAGGLRAPGVAPSVVVTVALMIACWRSPPDYGAGAGPFRRKAYVVAVVLEVAAIYGASIVLARLGLAAFLIPAVGAIVGLHVVGLWRASGDRHVLLIAGAMCAVSAAAVLLPAALTTGAGRRAGVRLRLAARPC